MTSRLRVQKTLKMYVGGAFIRSESGHTIPVSSSRGEVMHVCKASRKDLRDAVEIARAAQAGWAGRTAYNRGQILYRIGEILEDRAVSLPCEVQDVAHAVDRAVHHAGWADKITAVLSSLNPVGSAYVNYSMVRAVGVVVALPRAEDGLLGLVEATCASLLMGNSVILLVPAEVSELAIAYAEALATSDVPAGVVNILTGDVPSVLDWADKHDDIDTLYVAGDALDTARWAKSQAAAARVMRRLVHVPAAAEPADPFILQKLAEIKTVWMSS